MGWRRIYFKDRSPDRVAYLDHHTGTGIPESNEHHEEHTKNKTILIRTKTLQVSRSADQIDICWKVD